MPVVWQHSWGGGRKRRSGEEERGVRKQRERERGKGERGAPGDITEAASTIQLGGPPCFACPMEQCQVPQGTDVIREKVPIDWCKDRRYPGPG